MRTVAEILGAHPIDDTFWDNTNPADVDTVNSEEKMAGSHITKFHTPEDEEIVLDDLLSQVNQDFDNQHDGQLMAPKHDDDHGHHNPSDPPFTTSVDYKLVTCKDESIPSVTIQDEDYTYIMDELATMVESYHNTVQGFINDMVGNTNDPNVVKSNNNTTGENTKQPINQLRSPMSESTLHWISKMIMKEAVEDKKMELTRSSMKIPENNVEVLNLINTSNLYGLINDGINKYNHRNTVQGVTNDMVGNTNVSTTVHSSNDPDVHTRVGMMLQCYMFDLLSRFVL